jgi:putative endonuclease
MEKIFYTYILTNKRNGTLYIGVTSNLVRRIWQHKLSTIPSFTKKYRIKLLVHYEQHSDIENAILREKQLKKWRRKWKIALIEKHNPTWSDLYSDIIT